MSHCRYCAQIHNLDPSYPRRETTFDLESASPRCARHWRYVCQQCGNAHHFHAPFYCPDARQFICYRCAVERVEAVRAFWAWEYHYTYHCPLCQGTHPGLDYAEFLGEHPYQRYPEWEVAGRRLALDGVLSRRLPASASVTSPDELTDKDVAASWDAKAEVWASAYDQEGE